MLRCIYSFASVTQSRSVKGVSQKMEFLHTSKRFMCSAFSPTNASYEDVPDIVNQVAPYLAVAIVAEYIIATFKGLPTVRFNDGFSSIATGLLVQIVKLFIVSMELTIYSWVYDNFRVTSLPWELPSTWWLCFLGVDLGYYVCHRACHEVSILWAAHQVHHSSEDYNFTTSVRQSIVQSWAAGIFYLPLAFAVPPSVFYIHLQFNFIYQCCLHTELVGSLGPVEYVFNTPSHHRVHHGRNPYCIDKNYGGILIIWDRIFGTFQVETEEEIAYGLVYRAVAESWDPVWIQVCYFFALWKRVWELPGVGYKLSVLFKGPAWSPGSAWLGNHPHDIPTVDYPVVKYNRGLSRVENVYVLVHSCVAFAVYQALLWDRNVPTQPQTCGVTVFFLVTITSFGALFDNKWYAPFVEFSRCFGIAFLLNYEAVPSSLGTALRTFFMLSALMWLPICVKKDKAKQR